MTDRKRLAGGLVHFQVHRLVRWMTTAFIVFTIAAVLSGPYGRDRNPGPISQFFYPYLRWTGLMQRWSLFSPEPRRMIVVYRVEIKLKNGRKEVWRRPYPPNWDFFERHLSYSFQKWDLAGHYLEIPNLLWEDLANYVIRLYSIPGHPAEQVALIRSQAPLPPPNETGYVQSDPSKLVWSDQMLFLYDAVQKRFL